MITDALCNFVPPGQPLSLVAGAGVAVQSNVYDELGTGVGTAPDNIGNASVFGADYGVGEKPLIDVVVGTAFATSSGATLNVQFQGAVDTGSGGNYQPGTWDTLMETGPIAVGNLTAGQVIARFPFAMAFPPGTLPRYLRLNFVTPSGENFTAGTIAFATVTMVRDDQTNKYAARNYAVA